MPTILTEDDWNSHEATIRSLYLTENRKLQGPGGVMQEMLTKYGFDAKKSQYERQFKKWGFQKNKKKDVWEIVARKVTKRKRDNKESEVMIYGEIVPAKKLRKELSRYGYESAFPYQFQAPTPKTPEDLSLAVYTPQSHSLRYEWSPNLPWLRFEQKFSQILDTLNFNPSSALGKPSDPLSDSLCLWLGMRSPAGSGNTNIQRGEMSLNCIIPELYEGQNLARARSIFSPGRPGTSLESLKIFLYAFSNNLINDLGDVETITAFARTFLKMWTDRSLKQFDEFSTEPTLIALLGKCFQLACNSFDLDAMELCLKIGISPNLTVWDEKYKEFMKPIQIAAFEGDVGMARLLVRYGADVNKTGMRKQPSALSIAFLFQNMQLSKFLLSSGADSKQRFDPDISAEFKSTMEELTIRNYSWVGDLSPLSILAGNFSKPFPKSGNTHLEFLQEILENTGMDYPSKPLYEEFLAHVIIIAIILCPSKYLEGIIQTLIRNGGNINTELISGVLPISLAAGSDQSCCLTLLSLGAKPSLPHTSRYYNTRPAALHCSALYGDTKAIQALLQAGADVNHYVTLEDMDLKINREILIVNMDTSVSRYHTPLQFALASSSLTYAYNYINESKKKTARLLLSHGAKIFGGEMADAVELGDTALIQFLYRCGASLNEKSMYGLTPLQAAIHFRFDNIVSFLLNLGAKLQGRDLSDAIIARRPDELLELLRSRQATSGQNLMRSRARGELTQIFERAFASGEENVIVQILRLYPLYYKSSVLWAAITGLEKSGSKAKLEKLICDFLKRTTNIMSYKAENTAIAIAAYLGYTEILDIFLRKFTLLQSQVFALPDYSMKALLRWPHTFFLQSWTDWENPTYRATGSGCSPLVAAIMNGSEQILERLLHHGFYPDTASILVAIYLDKQELLIKLISKGVDLIHQQPEFDTPLQMAVRLHRAEIIQKFLDLKVDVNANPPQAVWGDAFEPRTALQLAVESKNEDLVHKLIDVGADVNAPAAHNSGATALQLAAAKGYLGLAKLLVEHGADINASGAKKSGRTTLEIAAEHGRIDMIQFFLDCVPGALTDGDYTQQYIHAVRLAERNGHIGAAMVLRNCRDWTSQDFELYEECGEFSDQDDEPEEDPEETDDKSKEDLEETDDELEKELEKADDIEDVLSNAKDGVGNREEAEHGNSNMGLDHSNEIDDSWWNFVNLGD